MEKNKTSSEYPDRLFSGIQVERYSDDNYQNSNSIKRDGDKKIDRVEINGKQFDNEEEGPKFKVPTNSR
jgi:hypothetical protein